MKKILISGIHPNLLLKSRLVPGLELVAINYPAVPCIRRLLDEHFGYLYFTRWLVFLWIIFLAVYTTIAATCASIPTFNWTAIAFDHMVMLLILVNALALVIGLLLCLNRWYAEQSLHPFVSAVNEVLDVLGTEGAKIVVARNWHTIGEIVAEWLVFLACMVIASPGTKMSEESLAKFKRLHMAGEFLGLVKGGYGPFFEIAKQRESAKKDGLPFPVFTTKEVSVEPDGKD